MAFNASPAQPNKEALDGALDGLFQKDQELSALIVFNEAAVELLMQALQERGKDVPADISVIAVASGRVVRHIAPPLSYIDVPSVEMGRAAIELLAGCRQSGLLPLHLVTGATLGPPPSRGAPNHREAYLC